MKRSVRGYEDMTHAGPAFLTMLFVGFPGMTDICLPIQKSWTYCVSRRYIFRVRDRGQSSVQKLSRTLMRMTTEPRFTVPFLIVDVIR